MLGKGVCGDDTVGGSGEVGIKQEWSLDSSRGGLWPQAGVVSGLKQGWSLASSRGGLWTQAWLVSGLKQGWSLDSSRGVLWIHAGVVSGYDMPPVGILHSVYKESSVGMHPQSPHHSPGICALVYSADTYQLADTIPHRQAGRQAGRQVLCYR